MSARIIDNKRVLLADVLRDHASKHTKLSIATGYWDLAGMHEIFQSTKDYESIRILIGQEPIPPQYLSKFERYELDFSFPEAQMAESLQQLDHSVELRDLVLGIKKMIDEGRLEVKVYRGNFLHSKAYIFGDLKSKNAVGIIGSSNFTKAGLTKNLELNALEDDSRIVKSMPHVETDEHGHLSWFQEIWNSDDTETWNGKFSETLSASPVGDKLFSPHLMYIKALYEIYSDELVPESELGSDIEEVLYEFQLRNAKLLLKKLEKNGLAMLADSVGLGKTITAGAVIRHYLEDYGSKRIYIIAPAGLAAQWRDDLAKVHNIFHGFEVISMQDMNRIRQARSIDKYADVDLFVVDEAHNLRSGGGSRHDELLDWFSDNPDSHVLLLTATPINNSLKDFVNQIQLAAKGKLESFPVVYPTDQKIEVIDFFEAVKRLTKEVNTAEKQGKVPNFDKVNRVMRQGLRHFLVRTTRRGIEREFGGIKSQDGKIHKFPDSQVVPRPYKFSSDLLEKLTQISSKHQDIFERHSPERLEVKWLLGRTQRAQHPLDALEHDAFMAQESKTAFERVFQVLLLIGFAPYKTEIYKHKFYNKSPEDIGGFALKPDESFRIYSQLSVHNMMRINFLKRLESSQFALKKSLENYLRRLNDFETLLKNNGTISRIKDVRNLRAEYGDDIEHLELEIGENDIETVKADPQVYNLEALEKDIHRDKALVKVLIEMCEALGENDDKLREFSNLIGELRKDQPAGKKILVFSYFADTVEYLHNALGHYYEKENLEEIAGFTNGKTKSQVGTLAKRFSPESKNGSQEVEHHGELDILFATDVLSEGQNLQDCGLLVNFDLHWNPVRMIQRNGRINRLGSPHETVHVYNIHPDLDLDEYLTLVNRLEKKIDRIRFTVGTDQSVLGEDANPIEYVDDLDTVVSEEGLMVQLYDQESANQSLNALDDDEDLLSEDEFVLDLRRFHSSATDEDRIELMKIPQGKWGKLSLEGAQKLNGANALALVKLIGRFADSDKEFVNHIFVSNTHTTGAVETVEALSAIRADSNENKSSVDDITLDRKTISRRSSLVAETHAKRERTVFPVTPSIARVLNAFQLVKPEIQLHEAIGKISTKQEFKKAKTLFASANRDLREGPLLPRTLEDLSTFAEKLGRKQVSQRIIKEGGVRGVLYFGR